MAIIIVIGKLETMREEFPYIIKSAMPAITDDDLNSMEKKLLGGPRKIWETRGNSPYHDYYSSLTSEQIEGLQKLYKWDCLLFNYTTDPLRA